jgi:hypothetical protein
MQDDQLAHLYITGFIEYNKGLKSTLCESHDQISHPLHQKRFIYRLLTRHDSLPVWLVADK